jgi:hypothetical protein
MAFSEWIGQPSFGDKNICKVSLLYRNLPNLWWRGIGNHDPRTMKRVKESDFVVLESNVVEIRVE